MPCSHDVHELGRTVAIRYRSALLSGHTLVVVILPCRSSCVTNDLISALRWSAGRPRRGIFLPWRMANHCDPLDVQLAKPLRQPAQLQDPCQQPLNPPAEGDDAEPPSKTCGTQDGPGKRFLRQYPTGSPRRGGARRRAGRQPARRAAAGGPPGVEVQAAAGGGAGPGRPARHGRAHQLRGRHGGQAGRDAAGCPGGRQTFFCGVAQPGGGGWDRAAPSAPVLHGPERGCFLTRVRTSRAREGLHPEPRGLDQGCLLIPERTSRP